MTDTDQNTSEPFIEYVRQKIQLADTWTTNEYALKSFLSFVRPLPSPTLTTGLLTSWVADLFLRGKKATTVKRYLYRLHVEYQEWSATATAASDPDPFDGLQALAVPEFEVTPGRVAKDLALVRRLITTGPPEADRRWMAMLLCLLYDPSLTVEDIVNLRFDTAPDYCPQTVEIIESMDRSHGRRYVFDLRQPDRRVPGMAMEIRGNIGRMLAAAGVEPGSDLRRHITAIWICAALKAGLRTDEIRALVADVPGEYRVLEKVRPAQLTEKERQALICRVADSISDITTRWYVVSMRDKNTPDDVKDVLCRKLPAHSGKIQYFYPTRTVYRESRRKRPVAQEVPLIPRILFVKVRSNLVNVVMGKISEVAWGYRYTNTPDSPYSVISQKAMTDFQRHIGIFSDDVKVELVKITDSLAKGQEVRILRDDMYGRIGSIESVKVRGGVRTYNILLTADTAMRITVKDISGAYLAPL